MRFLLTGGLAAAVNFVSCVLFNHWMGYSTAIILAYLVGMTSAFLLSRQFVFRGGKQALHHSAIYFVLVNAVGIIQTWAVSLSLATLVLPALGLTHFVPEIAHAVGVVVPVFTSYIGHKHLSFR
ncbi:MAG: GtrA family protein [Stagnimonas sp.]|nr:GtrA family protein [Stagnimonas sp.]